MKQLPKIEEFEGLSYEDAAFMRGDVADMISAAVQAEREACEEICTNNAIEHENTYLRLEKIVTDKNDIGLLKFAAWAGQAHRDAAAIRARSGQEEQKS